MLNPLNQLPRSIRDILGSSLSGSFSCTRTGFESSTSAPRTPEFGPCISLVEYCDDVIPVNGTSDQLKDLYCLPLLSITYFERGIRAYRIVSGFRVADGHRIEGNERIIRGLLKLRPNRRFIVCNSLALEHILEHFLHSKK